MVGFFLIGLGAVFLAGGLRLATERRRPHDLGGALLAPVGVGLAFWGVAKVLGAGWCGP